MSHKVVFLDRASLKAKVRKPKGASEYVEYQKSSADEIVPRLSGLNPPRYQLNAAKTPQPA